MWKGHHRTVDRSKAPLSPRNTQRKPPSPESPRHSHLGEGHDRHTASAHHTRDSARERRAAHAPRSRRPRPRARRHPALLAPPRLRPTKLPDRPDGALLAQRRPSVAGASVAPFPGQALRHVTFYRRRLRLARGGQARPISPAIRALRPPGSRGGLSCGAVAASITGCQASRITSGKFKWGHAWISRIPSTESRSIGSSP